MVTGLPSTGGRETLTDAPPTETPRRRPPLPTGTPVSPLVFPHSRLLPPFLPDRVPRPGHLWSVGRPSEWPTPSSVSTRPDPDPCTRGSGGSSADSLLPSLHEETPWRDEGRGRAVRSGSGGPERSYITDLCFLPGDRSPLAYVSRTVTAHNLKACSLQTFTYPESVESWNRRVGRGRVGTDRSGTSHPVLSGGPRARSRTRHAGDATERRRRCARPTRRPRGRPSVARGRRRRADGRAATVTRAVCHPGPDRTPVRGSRLVPRSPTLGTRGEGVRAQRVKEIGAYPGGERRGGTGWTDGTVEVIEKRAVHGSSLRPARPPRSSRARTERSRKVPTLEEAKSFS